MSHYRISRSANEREPSFPVLSVAITGTEAILQRAGFAAPRLARLGATLVGVLADQSCSPGSGAPNQW